MNQGYIRISDDIYRNEWGKIWIFMQDFLPIHIEYRHWENNIWYLYGFSEYFDELQEGEAVPQYDLIFFRENENENFKYEFKRV